jgi:hypothetical protein
LDNAVECNRWSDGDNLDYTSAGKKKGVLNPSRMNSKNIIADGVIIGLSASLLWHFSNIWRYGQYLVGEPNILIRSLETVGLVIILAFGVSKYVGDLR